jgi:hypothetical protein
MPATLLTAEQAAPLARPRATLMPGGLTLAGRPLAHALRHR